MGSSAIMHDNNWIGVACCVAFSTRDDPNNLRNEWEPAQLVCGFVGERWWVFSIPIPVLLRKDLVTVESDHLWLLYLTKAVVVECTGILESIEHKPDRTLYLETCIDHPQGLHIEVKRCGFRWVFTQDLEQLNATMMRSGSSNSIQIDDDLNSSAKKRKFMTIDDEPCH